MQSLADTAILFFAFWLLTIVALLVMWTLMDGIDWLLHFLYETWGSPLTTTLLLLAFSAMLAAATTAVYLYDAQ